MLRHVGFNGRTAGDQNYLMSGQSPGNLKTAKKMADTQNMLAILDDFHNYRFRVQGSGFWVLKVRFALTFEPYKADKPLNIEP